MPKVKSIFSLFSKDTPDERGSKNDGKGLNELKSENNVDTLKNLEHAKDIAIRKPAETVIQDNTKKRQKKHIKLHHFKKRPKDISSFRKLNKRHNELQDDKRIAEKEVKLVQKRVQKAPKTDQKIIRQFIERLDPSIQEEIRQNMLKNVQKQELKERKQQDSASVSEQKELSIRERIEQKRGAYRQSRQLKMLRVAKEIAERARKMVKDFRLRVTGKLSKEQPEFKKTNERHIHPQVQNQQKER